jgi:hypothetical protein
MDRIYGLVGTEGAGSLQASLLRIQNAGWPKVPVPKGKREQTRANLLVFRSNLLAFRSMCLVLFVRKVALAAFPRGGVAGRSSRVGKERAAKPRNEKAIDVLKPTVPRNYDSAPAMISAIFAKDATSLVSGLRKIRVGFVGLGFVEAPKRNTRRKRPSACAFRGSPSPGFEAFGREKVRERAAKLLESLGRVNLCALSARANLEACLGERHEGRLRPKCLDPAPPCQSANRARLRSKFDDALKGEGSCARRRSREADPDRVPPFAMKGAQFLR